MVPRYNESGPDEESLPFGISRDLHMDWYDLLEDVHYFGFSPWEISSFRKEFVRLDFDGNPWR